MSALMPAVSVNGTEITSAAIAAEAQNHNAPADKPGYAWRAAARALVIRQLMLDKAAEFGFAPDPQELAPGKVETDEESLIRQVAEQEIDAEPVSDDACQAIFDKQPELFRSPDLFQPAHILFPAKPDDMAARAEAKTNADMILAKVLDNPKTFGTLAREVSACPSKENGGELGQLASGDTVPEFEEVLAILNPGEIHPEVVSTRFGFHIIRMDEKVKGDALPYDAVKPAIRQKLEQVAWIKAANTYTRDLVESAEITGIDFTTPIGDAA